MWDGHADKSTVGASDRKRDIDDKEDSKTEVKSKLKKGQLVSHSPTASSVA